LVGAICLLVAVGQGFSPAAADPPVVLQIYREELKPGADAEYDRIERDQSRVCVDMKCPNPYLGVESLTGPKEAWFFNGYSSEAHVKQVADAYGKTKALLGAMARNAKRKASLTVPGGDVFASYRAGAGRGTPWSMGEGRYLVITVTKSARTFDGTVFETAEGIRYIIAAAQTREEAYAKAAAAGPDARVFVVRPTWSYPAPEWIAADPGMWAARGQQ
jgi:hypothetical protein